MSSIGSCNGITRLGLDAGEVHGDTAWMVAAAIEHVVRGLGLELHDSDNEQRLAQRAGLAARRADGHDDSDPDVMIGPSLSPEEPVGVTSVFAGTCRARSLRRSSDRLAFRVRVLGLMTDEREPPTCTAASSRACRPGGPRFAGWHVWRRSRSAGASARTSSLAASARGGVRIARTRFLLAVLHEVTTAITLACHVVARGRTEFG